MNELKKNDLIKAKKLCHIFSLIDDLNSITDGMMGNLKLVRLGHSMSNGLKFQRLEHDPFQILM